MLSEIHEAKLRAAVFKDQVQRTLQSFAMAKPYTHLAPEVRAIIELMYKARHGFVRIAEQLGRDGTGTPAGTTS